jgi:alpha-methylacyl-CoA racemase
VARGSYAATSTGSLPRVAPRFSETPGLDPGPERLAGANTTAYLLGRGFTAEQIADLLARGVLGQPST